MEVYMNGQSVDIRFEEEKTVKEVAESMTKWAAERDLIFTGMLLDDEFFVADNVPDKPIDKVGICDLGIQSKADLVISSLTEGISYCDRVVEYIGDCSGTDCFDSSDLEPFFGGIDWLIDVTTTVFSMLNLDLQDIKHMDRTVAEYLGDIGLLASELQKAADKKDGDTVLKLLDEQKQLFSLFKGIFKMAMLSDNIKDMVVRSIDSPDSLIKSLIESRDNLPQQLENLEKISEAFQSGHDEEASSLMHPFLDYMYTYSRTSIQSAPVFGIDPDELVVDGISISEKNRQINELLAEIVDVMESDDIISASDILEYELKPALESVPEYINQLLERIGA
ncbi:MAG: hypothetical protein JXK07_15520 [Spirochaetes bacterium]|nr:hypothetical protein [Spirochaetota bacterium]MBN2769525.1 hypothetical protein [Spirochaetota bacterium]